MLVWHSNSYQPPSLCAVSSCSSDIRPTALYVCVDSGSGCISAMHSSARRLAFCFMAI